MGKVYRKRAVKTGPILLFNLVNSTKQPMYAKDFWK